MSDTPNGAPATDAAPSSITEMAFPPQEAGYSTSMFLYHPQMGRVQYTFRGAMSYDWPSVMEDVGNFLRYMRDKGWVFEAELAPKPAAPAAPAPAASGPAPAAPQPTSGVPAPAAPAPVDTSAVNTLEVVKVKIIPQTDGKVEIQVFAADHQYPDLKMKVPMAKALSALSTTGYAWTEEILSKAAEFPIRFYADWRYSERLKSNGKPFQDIVNFRPIDASA